MNILKTKLIKTRFACTERIFLTNWHFLHISWSIVVLNRSIVSVAIVDWTCSVVFAISTRYLEHSTRTHALVQNQHRTATSAQFPMDRRAPREHWFASVKYCFNVRFFFSAKTNRPCRVKSNLSRCTCCVRKSRKSFPTSLLGFFPRPFLIPGNALENNLF